MKDVKKAVKMLIMVILLMTIATYTNAQNRDYGNRQRGEDHRQARLKYQERGLDMLDLSEEQTEKIEEIRIQLYKDQIQSTNQIREKQAQLRTSITQETIDKTKVFNLIDEIGKLRIESWKASTEAYIKIRALLTDKQKIIFYQHWRGPLDSRGNGFEHGLH